MPFDTQGNFLRIHNWEKDRKSNVAIMSDRHDEEDDNFAEALNECFLRDGRIALQGNLNAGNFQIKNVAQASADSDAVNLEQVTAIKNNAVEELQNIISSLYCIGDIKPSLQVANHNNWLLCNGQAVSRTDYAELYALIGNNFGSGDGTTTFNLPDYRGKFLRGLGGNSAADVYTTQAEGLPDFSVSFVAGRLVEPSGAVSNTLRDDYGTDYSTSYRDYNSVISPSKSNAIYGASDHVTPINQAVNWFIKAKGE